MKLAIVSDIHGNIRALKEVARLAKKRGAAGLICLGDFVDPFPGSAECASFLKTHARVTLRGNHEDYVTEYRERIDLSSSLRYQPIGVVRDSMSESELAWMRALPLHSDGKNFGFAGLFLSHASPLSNFSGDYRWLLSEASRIRRVPAGPLRRPLPGEGVRLRALLQKLGRSGFHTFICGHWHDPFDFDWKGLRLIGCGSTGLPLNGHCRAEWISLEKTAESGSFGIEFIETEYDALESYRDYERSGWIEEGGPIASLLAQELKDGARFLFPVLQSIRREVPFRDLDALVPEVLSREVTRRLNLRVESRQRLFALPLAIPPS